MKYLLDTNVISELQKKKADAGVKAFIGRISLDDLFLSVITMGEICRGVEKLPLGKKRGMISTWLYSTLPKDFQGRILAVDLECMVTWGKLSAETKRTLSVFDSLLAATALTHNMTLLSRNAKDFVNIAGLHIINPWEASF